MGEKGKGQVSLRSWGFFPVQEHCAKEAVSGVDSLFLAYKLRIANLCCEFPVIVHWRAREVCNSKQQEPLPIHFYAGDSVCKY